MNDGIWVKEALAVGIILLFVGTCIIPSIIQGNLQDSIQDYQYMLNSVSLAHQKERKTSQYPPDFQIDDLVFFDSTYPPGRWNVPGLDHVAIYLGNDSFICTSRNTTIHKIEINIVSYDHLFLGGFFKNPRYARVINATPEQRHAAAQWTISHLKDKYQTFDPRKIADPNASIVTADRWYCSEFVWAAYYNAGIDIDRNGWDRDFPWFFPIWSSVSCDDIYYDNDVVHFS
jgi:hypothetical protein